MLLNKYLLLISLGVLVDPDYHSCSWWLYRASFTRCCRRSISTSRKNINELGPITEYLKAHPDGKGLMERVLDGLTVNEVYNEPIHFNVVVDAIALKPKFMTIKRRR